MLLGIHRVEDGNAVPAEGIYLDFRDYAYVWQATALRRRILEEAEALRSAAVAAVANVTTAR